MLWFLKHVNQSVVVGQLQLSYVTLDEISAFACSCLLTLCSARSGVDRNRNRGSGWAREGPEGQGLGKGRMTGTRLYH